MSWKARLFLIIIGSIILFCGIYIWNFASEQRSLYAPNKNEIQAELKLSLDTLQPKNEVVYFRTVDECTKGDLGWLGSRYSCAIRSWKLFKGQGDPLADMQQLDDSLRSRGLTRANIQPASLLFERGVSYKTKDFYSFDTNLKIFAPKAQSSETARSFFNLSADIPLDNKEYAYGVSIYALYWSCSVNSFIQLPCIPPSPIK